MTQARVRCVAMLCSMLLSLDVWQFGIHGIARRCVPCTLDCKQFHVLQFSMGGLDMPFEDIKGPLSNWVTTKSIQLEIKRRFRGFLEAYKDDADELVYKKRVRDMCVGELTTHRGCIHHGHMPSKPAFKSCQISTALFFWYRLPPHYCRHTLLLLRTCMQ